MAKINKPIKIHGGKDTLAPKIIALMPKRYLTYCEPYLGGGSVLLGLNPEGHSEIANDLDGELMNFWDMLASEFGHLQELLERTPFSEMGFNRALRDINEYERLKDAFYSSKRMKKLSNAMEAMRFRLHNQRIKLDEEIRAVRQHFLAHGVDKKLPGMIDRMLSNLAKARQ